MTSLPTISVVADVPQIVVNGLVIVTALDVDVLYNVLGKPDRVDICGPPAPFGHRNNQSHVYDDLGLHFIEHHYSRLVGGISCWLNTDEALYPFTPHRPFIGTLTFDGVLMPLNCLESVFRAASPFTFVQTLTPCWDFSFAGFAIGLVSQGSKLRSGRRSRSRRIVEVSVEWPHDNWAVPKSQ